VSPAPHPEPRWIAVGKIGRAHGVKGEVSVLPLSTVGDRFAPGARLFVGDAAARPVTVSASRPHQQRLLIRFEEIRGRDSAESLRGQYLFVPADSLPDLPEGEYWPHDLIGCRVESEDGAALGVVREVMRSAANDLWVTDSDGGELLIPALRDVVASVDVAGRRIVVRSVPGLTGP